MFRVWFEEVSEGISEGTSQNTKCTVTPQYRLLYHGSHASAPANLKAAPTTCTTSLFYHFLLLFKIQEKSEDQNTMFTCLSSLLFYNNNNITSICHCILTHIVTIATTTRCSLHCLLELCWATIISHCGHNKLLAQYVVELVALQLKVS